MLEPCLSALGLAELSPGAVRVRGVSHTRLALARMARRLLDEARRTGQADPTEPTDSIEPTGGDAEVTPYRQEFGTSAHLRSGVKRGWPARPDDAARCVSPRVPPRR